MSKYTTVRITTEQHELLRKLADRENATLQAVLERALDQYRRQSFLDDLNQAYGALSAGASAALTSEFSAWEPTLADGLGSAATPGHDRVATRAPRRRAAIK